MAKKKLATTVHVHRDGGETVIYEAGQEVPVEDAKLITNPQVWEPDDDALENPRGEDNSDSGSPRVVEKRGGGNPARGAK